MESIPNTIIFVAAPGTQRQAHIEQYIKHHHINPWNVQRIAPGEKKKTISIEELRDTTQKFLLSSDGHRCLWIDDIDQSLTIPALQTLLKICEDPPTNGHIFLTTEHPDRLPATIRSRAVIIHPTHNTNDQLFPAGTPKQASAFIQAITHNHPDKIQEWIPHIDKAIAISNLLNTPTPWNSGHIQHIAQSNINMKMLAAAILCWYERHKRAVPTKVNEHIALSRNLDMPENLSKYRLLYLIEQGH